MGSSSEIRVQNTLKPDVIWIHCSLLKLKIPNPEITLFTRAYAVKKKTFPLKNDGVQDDVAFPSVIFSYPVGFGGLYWKK